MGIKIGPYEEKFGYCHFCGDILGFPGFTHSLTHTQTYREREEAGPKAA